MNRFPNMQAELGLKGELVKEIQGFYHSLRVGKVSSDRGLGYSLGYMVGGIDEPNNIDRVLYIEPINQDAFSNLLEDLYCAIDEIGDSPGFTPAELLMSIMGKMPQNIYTFAVYDPNKQLIDSPIPTSSINAIPYAGCIDPAMLNQDLIES